MLCTIWKEDCRTYAAHFQEITPHIKNATEPSTLKSYINSQASFYSVMTKRLHKTALRIYWHACQHPWNILANISFAALLYALAVIYGPSIQISFLGRLAELSGTAPLHNLLRLTLDIFISYILFTAISALILLPLILRKGLVLNILGYTFFYWFLFFPLHLLIDIMKNEVWTPPFRVGIAILVIIIFVIFTASLFYFPNSVKSVHLTFMTSKISSGIRIVHLSDVHAENFGPRETRLTAIVNELNPDVILISGDLLIVPCARKTKSYETAVRLVENLTTKFGIYIVEGHHDINKTDYIAEAFKTKVKILRDEWYHFNAHGINLSIFGATLQSRKSNFIENKAVDNHKIYFAHGPALVRNLASSNFDLALFGHTHASQVYLPIVSYLLVGKYRHGLYSYNNIPFYVNGGVGLEGYLAPRIRWFTYPEVVTIDLIPEDS